MNPRCGSTGPPASTGRSGVSPGSMSSWRIRSATVRSGMAMLQISPKAPSSSCMHMAMTLRSKRGSLIPGIDNSNWPDRKGGVVTPKHSSPRGGENPRHAALLSHRTQFRPVLLDALRPSGYRDDLCAPQKRQGSTRKSSPKPSKDRT